MSYFDKFIPGNVAIFNIELKKLASALGTDAEWHKAVMLLESGFKPNAFNADGGASGLIQFYPDVKNGNYKTLSGKKVDLTYLRSLSAVDQLPYVYMYYSSFKNRIKSIFDLYMVNFIPAGLNKPDNFLLDFPQYHLPSATIAKANPAIDLNKDGKIYVYEFKDYIRKKIPAEVLSEIEKKKIVD